MGEVKRNKKRLSINLSLLPSLIIAATTTNFLKSFKDPNGAVVGLGIVASMNKNNGNSRAVILAISPRSTTSNPIPIFTKKSSSPKKKKKRPSIQEMEMCEEYTCVISHVGTNLIKKREYFDAEFIGNTNSDKPAIPARVINHGGDTVKFRMAHFLNSCFLCKKQL
ncbi:hypothetical protein P3S68_003901 [Capsicum galapagoense]